jgi:hypothetical protein
MADPTLADYQLFYTGGGANADLSASIGGAASSVRVLNQTTSGLTLVTGVTIDDASGNEIGDGTLTFTFTATTLTWTPPGGVEGAAIDVGTDGRYCLQGDGEGAGCLFVTVVALSLPGSDAVDTITIAEIANTLFADVTKLQALAGVSIYHCFAVKNVHDTAAIGYAVEWIAANTPGQDSILIGLDPLAASDGTTGPTPVADEFTAPSGVTFVSPVSISDPDILVIGELAAGQVRFIWLKLLVPPYVTEAQPVNTFNRGYAIAI